MLAYVDLVQRKEKEIGCDVLTHQKWYANGMRHSLWELTTGRVPGRSGAAYIDRILATVSSGSSSTQSTGGRLLWQRRDTADNFI
jgi:isocitrate lyase